MIVISLFFSAFACRINADEENSTDPSQDIFQTTEEYTEENDITDPIEDPVAIEETNEKQDVDTEEPPEGSDEEEPIPSELPLTAGVPPWQSRGSYTTIRIPTTSPGIMRIIKHRKGFK